MCECECVCVCVCSVQIIFHICLRRPAIVPIENVGFAKNVRIESYSEKYLSGRLCGDRVRVDRRVDMEHTNSQVSRKYDELITKQAAKRKEQAATAKELMLHRARAGKVA